MKFKTKAALASVGVVLGLCALPAVRDELDWQWTQMRDQAADYMSYETDWPKGRHVVEARYRYQQREWKDSTRAQIKEAVKKNVEDQDEADARQERRRRLELFLWNQATNEGTLLAYSNYLQRYPDGQFAFQARRRVQDLQRQGAATNSSVR